MNDKQIISSEEKHLENAEQSLPVQRFTPAVDIYETEQELVLQADLPGVTENDLQLEVNRGILTLEAEQAAVEGAARKAYYRQFKVSERIDADAGAAELKDGVLTLRLPKRESAKPKKIAVQTLH
ncbi:Hsp20/alpha crystallin family protein [Malonomonas rubra]|uniref:Hsp20/alpha crystallin family protein n=1 Tax=Malonomonas rubra TaxID=57040 RepID=UPI0026E950F6|nr:Hsp20/alpha crystallin family protein [Malonomonas rubra]